MISKILTALLNQFRPRDGWFPFLLGLILTICLATAIEAAAWVPPSQYSRYFLPAAYLYGTILAHSQFSRRQARQIAALYTPFALLIPLANLIPPLTTLLNPSATAAYWRLNLTLLWTYLRDWFLLVIQGQQTEETAVLALLILALSWLFALSLSWHITRSHHPHRPLLFGLGLISLNAYFSTIPFFYIALYLGTTAILIPLLHHLGQRHQWQQQNIDYSDQLIFDLLAYTSILALLLFTLTSTLPAIPDTPLAQAVTDHPLTNRIEQTWERLFGERIRTLTGQTVRRRGTMPRNFLLGNAPELSTTVVMTATINPPPPVQARYWRALSYDIYTIEGWSLSPEQKEILPANDTLDLPAPGRAQVSQQTVNWLFDERISRYMLGTPIRFDQEATLFWLDDSQLMRVHGKSFNYTITSYITTPSRDDLRQAALQPIPEPILTRYTNLPSAISSRVYAEAQRVAGHLDNPYDQARALENYLRQFPYDLDVPLPPDEADPVDYFLFDLQRGYCDYYASAMVVMARALGIPARFSIGYLSSQPGAANQTIYQIDGHAWPEIYFPAYGWIPFEPTAAFSPLTWQLEQPFVVPSPIGRPEPAFPEETFETPPIPTSDTTTTFTLPSFRWLLALPALLLTALLWALWQRRPTAQPTTKLDTLYHQLHHYAHKTGLPPAPHLTPHEFSQQLNDHLTTQHQQTPFPFPLGPLQQLITHISQRFAHWRYQPPTPPPTTKLTQQWDQYQPPLRRHTWRQRLRQLFRRQP
ncbi:MAG TPA: transglutaminase domain-containing protein [Anaerolineae bacterium]|nr:transglutaminase domain-containing protein [Anaerolineae bacterium]